MRLIIKLELEGGEPVPSSEVEKSGRGEVHKPLETDTRQATLRQVLASAAEFVERRCAELSGSSIDPVFSGEHRQFGHVVVSVDLKE